jgi:hypothetical protein
MDNFFVNIIILPMLSYFQLLYGFFINLNDFTLHYLRLFMVILNYFWLFLVISPYVTLNYSKLLLTILAYHEPPYY